MAKAKGKTPSKKSRAAASAKPKPKPAKAAKPKAKAKAKPAKAKPAAKAKAKPASKAKAKPAKAKPAKAKPAKPAKPAAARPAQVEPAAAPSISDGVTGAVAYSELARSGNLDALFGLMDLQSETKNDRLAYKWLHAASDFGHENADELIGDVMEVSSMRYDDDQYETAAAHWELAAAYLEGTEGLPVDLGLAKKHLALAFEIHDLDAINAATDESYAFEPLLDRLTDDARAVLEAALPGTPVAAEVEDAEPVDAVDAADDPAPPGVAAVSPSTEVDLEADDVDGAGDDGEGDDGDDDDDAG